VSAWLSLVVLLAQSPLEAEVTTRLRPLVTVAGHGPPARWWTLAERMRHHRVPGLSVAVVDRGQMVWARGFGVTEAGTDHAVTPRTAFQAGSIGKPITATAALAWVDERRLDLDGDVNDHLRTWRVESTAFTAVEKVTLRRLLSHTAGLSVPSFAGYGWGEPLPTVLDVLAGRPPANTAPVRVTAVPGSACRYSGGGYTVVQTLLADVAGLPFATLMEREVLGPLSMLDSTFVAAPPGAAAGHLASGAPIPGGGRRYPELAAAGLWSTPIDLMKWALAIAAARAGMPDAILSQAMATEMLTIQRGSVVGLGPFVRGSGATLQFGHQGWTAGFHARVMFVPALGRGAAVMANGVGGRTLVREVLAAIAAAAAWPNPPAPEKLVPLRPAPGLLERVLGRYEGGTPIPIVVSVRRVGTTLLLDAPELGPETPVVFTGPTELTTLDGGDRFTVRTSSGGRMTLEWGEVSLVHTSPGQTRAGAAFDQTSSSSADPRRR
jgi:CubicO group peptidase (beta-lactamase class C family)